MPFFGGVSSAAAHKDGARVKAAFSLPERNAKKKLMKRHFSSKINAEGKFKWEFRRLRAATRAARPSASPFCKRRRKLFYSNVR